MNWQQLHPNEHGDWLNQRNDVFSSFIPLGDKDNKENKQTFFVPFYSNGLKTQRDAWCYNASKAKLTGNIKYTIDFYNNLVKMQKENCPLPEISDKEVSMTRAFQNDLEKEREKIFYNNAICTAHYRPFNKTNCYFHPSLNEMIYKMLSIFPIGVNNIVICINGAGSQRDFSSNEYSVTRFTYATNWSMLSSLLL